MIEMARDRVTREQMGERGLAKVRTEYDWELKVDRILSLYRDAILRS